MKKISIFFILVCLILSCSKDYIEINDEEIKDYLSDNNLTATKTESGLYYFIKSQGDGDFPDISDEVEVRYEGRLLNEKVFDNGNGQIVSFPLTAVIEGWTEGIQLIDRGGSISLYIPSHLAYGDSPPGNDIPENAVLIFEVDLIDF